MIWVKLTDTQQKDKVFKFFCEHIWHFSVKNTIKSNQSVNWSINQSQFRCSDTKLWLHFLLSWVPGCSWIKTNKMRKSIFMSSDSCFWMQNVLHLRTHILGMLVWNMYMFYTIYKTTTYSVNSLRPSYNIGEHRSGSTLAFCLMAPSHYLNQYWISISKIMWHSPESNFAVSAQVAALNNKF